MFEFINHTTPTARKEHICDLCGGRIKIGEKYERQTGKVEGDFYDMKAHPQCLEICSRYCRHYDENEFVTDDVIDWIRCNICDDCESRDSNTCSHNTPFTCAKVQELTKDARKEHQ